jgi:CheY-like chemotaxis protein
MAEDSLTIVVVDDDDGHIELVRRNLRRSGIDDPIDAVYGGAAALDYVFRRGAHAARTSGRLVILLDINMPGGIDGIEVLRQVKGHASTRRIPVIMLTTTDDPRDVERCYDLGCNVYLTKSADPDTFSQAMERLAKILSVARLPTSAARPVV